MSERGWFEVGRYCLFWFTCPLRFYESLRYILILNFLHLYLSHFTIYFCVSSIISKLIPSYLKQNICDFLPNIKFLYYYLRQVTVTIRALLTSKYSWLLTDMSKHSTPRPDIVAASSKILQFWISHYQLLIRKLLHTKILCIFFNTHQLNRINLPAPLQVRIEYTKTASVV